MGKNNINWVNLLHFYQPPSINKDTIDAVVKNSYSFIIKILKESKKAKISANINTSLLEHFYDHGHGDLIKEIYKLAKRGKIDLVLSAAYHPVLALVPRKEAVRQIRMSKKTYEKFFPGIKPRGFFFPEMVYDKNVAKELKKFGIKWIILDEISYGSKFGKVDFSKKYIDKNSGLQVIFRHRMYSQDYTPNVILDILKKGDFSGNLVTATDAELYGDRHIDYTGDFYHVVRDKRIKTQTVDEFAKGLKEKEVILPKKSSWDASENEFKKGKSLNLWKNPQNKIHVKLWELTNLALNLVEGNKKDKGYKWARLRLDKGLSSCVYWWASEKDFGLMGPPAWHPDQIIAGADDLIKSIRSLSSISVKDKLKAEKLYLKIEDLVWKKHWNKYYSRSVK